jgi:hypothetical protein
MIRSVPDWFLNIINLSILQLQWLSEGVFFSSCTISESLEMFWGRFWINWNCHYCICNDSQMDFISVHVALGNDEECPGVCPESVWTFIIAFAMNVRSLVYQCKYLLWITRNVLGWVLNQFEQSSFHMLWLPIGYFISPSTFGDCLEMFWGESWININSHHCICNDCQIIFIPVHVALVND